MLLLGACERYDAARDQALRDHLATMRQAIENFHAREGRYPHSLQELVPKYMTGVPVDPITQSDRTWRVTTEETVQPSTDFTDGGRPSRPPRSGVSPDREASGETPDAGARDARPPIVIVDVHSGAPGADRDGVLYSNY